MLSFKKIPLTEVFLWHSRLRISCCCSCDASSSCGVDSIQEFLPVMGAAKKKKNAFKKNEKVIHRLGENICKSYI